MGRSAQVLSLRLAQRHHPALRSAGAVHAGMAGSSRRAERRALPVRATPGDFNPAVDLTQLERRRAALSQKLPLQFGERFFRPLRIDASALNGRSSAIECGSQAAHGCCGVVFVVGGRHDNVSDFIGSGLDPLLADRIARRRGADNGANRLDYSLGFG
jgi:hypothetical protein